MIATGLPAPTGLVVHEDALYVSDRELGEIRVIARSGEPLAEHEIAANGLASPEGFVVTADGFFVVEADAAQLVRVDADGARTVLAEFPSGSSAVEGLPPSQVFNGVALDEEGALFITGENERVLYRLEAP